MSNKPSRNRIIAKLNNKGLSNNAISGNILPHGAGLNGFVNFKPAPTKLDIWAETHTSYYKHHNFNSGNFSVAYLGVDYLITPEIVGGILAEGDIINQNNFNNAYGTGWLVGPYISSKLERHLYLYTSASFGGSYNKINPLDYYNDSFKTSRSLYNAELIGDFNFKKLTIMPNAGITYYSEQQHSYTNSLKISIPRQTISLKQLNFGPEFSYPLNSNKFQRVLIFFNMQGIYNFTANENSVERNFYPIANFFGRTRLAFDILMFNGLSLRPMISYDGLGNNSFHAVQAQIQISMPLS